LLIYYSKNPGSGGFSAVARAKKVQATVVPEKRYKKSEDGKVVYLFDDDEEKNPEKPAENRPDGPGGEEGKE
jgi:hypothetical protein